MSGKVEVFYADAVDKHGNIVAHTELKITHCPLPVTVTKIPAAEIVIDPDATIRAILPPRKG